MLIYFKKATGFYLGKRVYLVRHSLKCQQLLDDLLVNELKQMQVKTNLSASIF